MAVSQSRDAQSTTGVLDPLTVQLSPWPIASELIRSGTPEAAGIVIARSEDRRTVTGVWECTPGTFDWNYTWDETITVVAGRVTITDQNGVSRTIRPGNVAHFPLGLRATWTVHETVRKVFALISPTSVDL